MRRHLFEAGLLQPARHLLGLMRRQLDAEPAARAKPLPGLARDALQQLGAEGPREERPLRLVGELRRQLRGVAFRQVGRVRHDHVKASIRHRREAVAAQQLHALRQLEPLRVAPSHLEGRRREIGGGDLRLGSLLRQRQRDRSGAGAEIEDPQRGLPVLGGPKGGLDQRLGLRPGNQHVRRHLERKRPELLRPEQQGHGHALLGPAAHQLAEARPLLRRHRLLEIEVEAQALDL